MELPTQSSPPLSTTSPPLGVAPAGPARGRARVPLVLGGAVLLVLASGGLLLARAAASANHLTLDASPKGVTVVEAPRTAFRPTRRFVGTLQPWLEAKVGPQLVSAYVDTVLVRPGDVVKRGQVLATLDCRNASAASQGVAMQARALGERQRALANEAARVEGLRGQGFVSENEAEQRTANNAATLAQIQALDAQLAGKNLEVSDCVLRAPFDGEVAVRSIDPGAFARPGVPVVSVIDRATVRLSAEVPESDFAAVAPGTQVKVRLLATGKELTAPVSRRSPAANVSTRTVHIELDLADPERALPVGTTGELKVEVGEPVPATEVPLRAAVVRGPKASLFLVEGDVAKAVTVKVLGEAGASLFVEPLAPGAQVVTEGRALLRNNDRVAAKRAAGGGPADDASAGAARPTAAPAGAANSAGTPPANGGRP
ncbi:MAG: efflux RND transporter periplasmic adaptor subunit [Polyangiaceae bacterium]|nr:efflux RND transporter periplasmic adaptor subunit [Polyangiaceae bacterium]